MFDTSYYNTLKRMDKPEPRYVVSLSSGASSAVAAERAINRYGLDRVDLVFMDTLWEDDDNYRFLSDLEKRWKPIIRLTEGRTPLEVAADEHIIPNQKIAPCTKRLKIEPFLNHVKGLQAEGYLVVIILGFSYAEQHRMKSPRRNYGAAGMLVEYPLMWKPYDLRPMDTVKSWGIEPPQMYRQGYSHANCGGRCVKQGKGDWQRTLLNYPERFTEVEGWELAMKQDPRFAEYAFLRDQKNGVTRAMTLAELRQQVEGTHQISMFDLMGGLLDETNCFCNAGDPGEIVLAVGD